MGVQRRVQQRENKEGGLKKKPVQPEKNGDLATRDVKVQEGATEEKCVVGPVVTRAHVKKSDTIHLLKVKEVRSRIKKSTIEDIQKKDSALKKCFDQAGKELSERNMLESSS